MTTKLIDLLYDLKSLDRARVRIADIFQAYLDDATLCAIAGVPMIAGGATNQVFDQGEKLAVVCTDGGALSGAPGRYGVLTGVAMADKRSDNLTPMDFGNTVWNLSVKGVDDSGNVAVAVGDLIFYVDADTPKLSKKASGTFFGVALQAVNSGATTTIQVLNLTGIPGAAGAGNVIASPTSPTGAFLKAMATYDFAVDGGVIGLITPAKNTVIPTNAIIIGGVLNVITTFTSGGAATVSVGLSAGGGGAAALRAAPASINYAAGLIAIIPVFTAATAIKMTAPGAVTLTVAVAALTAGKMDVLLDYMVGSG